MANLPGYILENVHTRNWAVLMNDNDGDDVISGTDADEDAGHKVGCLLIPYPRSVMLTVSSGAQWEVRRLCNGKFILRNQQFKNFASYKLTDDAGHQASVISIRTGTVQHWCINRHGSSYIWCVQLLFPKLCTSHSRVE
jgi:hypothetical protein